MLTISPGDGGKPTLGVPQRTADLANLDKQGLWLGFG